MDLQETISSLPKVPGVYLMKDNQGKVIYVGKAKSLKDRVNSYFQESTVHPPKIECLVEQIESVDYLETESEIDALILESRLIKDIQPKYNTRQKDSKSYPYILISKENFPRVLIGRENDYPKDKYKFFGPFVDSYGLKKSFPLLQKIFKFRTCHLDIKPKHKENRFFRPCLLASIKYCSAPCNNRIEEEEYQKNIKAFERFLKGKRKQVIAELEKEMKEAAAEWQFEKAAELRDQIKALNSLDKQAKMGDFIPGGMLHLDPQMGLKMLQDVLEMPEIPRVIEGIDISHHGGKDAVGSLVCFVDGIPYREGYRRYKIQSQTAWSDDYQMLREVFRRRFLGQDKDRKPPDIFLVDGGKGQLSSVLAELQKWDIKIPMLLSLAKKREEVFLPGYKKPLDIPDNSVAHHLLCHVRDESHRFAQGYHHLLKRKNVKKK